jgi:hypothetical protein
MHLLIETSELCRFPRIDVSDFKDNVSYPLDASIVATLKNHYGLNFETQGFEIWLRTHAPNDNLPYKVHAGRELDMMLGCLR